MVTTITERARRTVQPPPESRRQLALEALGRYRELGLEREGETLAIKIQERLREGSDA